MLEYFLYLLIGRILIYTGMKFPPFSNSRYEFVRELFACDFCLGIWIYSILSGAMGTVLFEEIYYFPVVSHLVTASISSFIVHVFLIGWREKFQTIVIE